MTKPKKEPLPEGIRIVESDKWWLLESEDKKAWSNDKQRLRKILLHSVEGKPDELLYIPELDVDRSYQLYGGFQPQRLNSTPGTLLKSTLPDVLPEPTLMVVVPYSGLVQVKPVIMLFGKGFSCRPDYLP